MRALSYILLCTLVALSAFAAPVYNADEAVKRVEISALPEGRDNVILKVWGLIQRGTEIWGTKELALVAPAEGYAVYIDDYPTANMFHPVRYAFVVSATGEVTVAPALSPPANPDDYQTIETAIQRILMAATNHRARIGKGEPPPSRADRWAVLMNGGYDSGNNHVRYWNDLSNIYITLNATYGFADDHIIVLCSDGLNPAPDQSNGLNSDPDLDNDGDDDIMYPCLLNTVNAVFAQLTTVLTADDKLFIFTTDHGSSAGGWNTIQNLWNHEELTDAHFAELLAALPQCEIICTLEPCYSGGFLDNIVVPPGPVVASSSARYDQLSWAMPPDYVYDTYVFHWTAAVKGEDAYGVQVDADYNNDGLVTMDEAYRYAELHDQSAEDPQYDDEPNGVGMGLSLWPSSAGPFLIVADQEIDDIGGNNNGAPDPGENISLILTLSNVGNSPATNIVGMLSTTDPYLTITQNSSTFPNLGHFEAGAGTPAYLLSISGTCPQGQTVTCDLHITADSAYTNDVVVTFIVGDPLYAPVGPDAYGYYAYDNNDMPGGPTYSWIEIAPAGGGPGTEVTSLTNRDDASALLSLPFSFRYYGQDYNQITICTNGWVAVGDALPDSDWSNTAIPNADGPPRMLAPFWEDMNLENNGGQIATYSDQTNHTFIVEFYRVKQWSPAGALETFEVIFYDPAHYPTPTGDGQILFQYAQVSDPTSCTVGIENSDETIGLQYLFDETYDPHAAPIAVGRAILFTTVSGPPSVTVALAPYGAPIQISAQGGSFDFNVAVTNNESEAQTFDAWCDVTLPGGSSYGPVLGPLSLTLPALTSINRNRTQTVPGSAPQGTYSYNGYAGDYPTVIWSSDYFNFEKLGYNVGIIIPGWSNTGEDFGNDPGTASLPEQIALLGVAPNPFNPVTTISFSLAQATKVKLSVFDLGGRLVATLVQGDIEAGTHQVRFEAKGLASGIYLYRLEAGEQYLSGKLVYMK